MLYRLLLGIDSFAALVALGFFAAGLADGTVSARNITLWVVLLGIIGGILALGVALNHARKPQAARSVLLLLAIPALGAALFVTVAIFAPPDWN